MKQIPKFKKLLLVLILTFFYSCQDDEFQDKHENFHQQQYKHVSIDELPQVKPLLDEMKKIKPNTSITSKSSETFLGIDNVNTDDIIQITDENNMNNFTFGIYTDFENSQYYENLILSEVDNGYIAYIMRYTPTQEWINDPNSYTPEGDLVVDLNTFDGVITKYALDRQIIWSTEDSQNKSSGSWVTTCFFTTTLMCTNLGHNGGNPNGDPHVAGSSCINGPFFTQTEEFCFSSYLGGGSSSCSNYEDGNYPDDPTGGGNNPHNDDCEETSGTLISSGQSIDGINTGCTSNETIGIKQPQDNYDPNCDSLKKLTATDSLSANILPLVNTLRTKTNENVEYSVNFRKNINFGKEYEYMHEDGIQAGRDRTTSIFKLGNTNFGQIHTHPNKTYPMFSWSDVARIKDAYEELNDDFDKRDIFIMIVNHNGSVYSLKINDAQKLIDKIDEDYNSVSGSTEEEKEKVLNRRIQELFNINKDNLEGTFLNRFKDFGISLYKATDQNLSNWDKLELEDPNDKNSNIIPQICN